MMNQKEAVYQAVINTIGLPDDGCAVGATKEQRAVLNNILCEGFKAGSISYDGAIPEDKELRAYVSGLVSNWLRKDNRLNGGVKYTAKNPGSRTGSTDPQVKAMRLLLATKTDAAEREEIQAFIDERVAELKPSKSVEIDVSALPEELKHLVK